MRNYGQGASGAQQQQNKSNNKSFAKKLKYHFDNSISRAGNFVLYLLLISFLLGLLMTIIIYLMDHPAKWNFFDKWWENVTKILKIGAGDTWEKRILEFLFWIFGVAISGTVIGFITSGISNLIIKLKKGKSHVISTNHIVILGWSNRIFPILKELNLANENIKKPVVLIFANMSREKMEDEINAKTKNLKNLKVITRSGDPTNPKELEIVNINEAKSVVILDPDGKSDATVIATILAIRIVNTKEKLTIITEISDPAHSISLQRIRNFNIIPVMSDNIIANITAQACRQPGLGVVFLDFLDFEGDDYRSINRL
jgi:ion channel POLLUX/CASTOR